MKKKNTDRIWNDPKAFRQQVRMAAVQVAGLSSDELAVALAYEVEPFSAIPAKEAELVFRPVVDPDTTVRVFDVAVVRSTGRKGGSWKSHCVLLLLAAVSVTLCVLAWRDYKRIQAEEARLAAEIASRSSFAGVLQNLQKELAELQKKIDENRNKAKSVRDTRVGITRGRQNTEVLRDVYRFLLATISDAFGKNAVLKEIKCPKPYSAEITAVSLNTKAASETLVNLSNALVPRGWSFEPGVLTNNEQTGTVGFSCTVTFDEKGEFK